MRYKISLCSESEPITEHWFGNYDDHPMPCLGDGTPLVNLISIDTPCLPGLPQGLPRRIYLPWSFDSDYGITDTNYIQYSNSQMSLLTMSEVQSYGLEEPFSPMALLIEEVSEESAESLWPRWLLGSEPIGLYYEGHFNVTCKLCGRRVQFFAQLQSTDDPPGFLVFDGETLYYGWCESCQVLAVEAHTQ